MKVVLEVDVLGKFSVPKSLRQLIATESYDGGQLIVHASFRADMTISHFSYNTTARRVQPHGYRERSNLRYVHYPSRFEMTLRRTTPS